jgi:hypothetical protein
MPNWKKVIVSGSAAVLSSVTASFTGSLTGALIGTASWATNATNAITSSVADSVATIRSTTSANYFLTFVDSNNGAKAYEQVFTGNNIVYNPGTSTFGTVNISASSILSSAGFTGSLLGTSSWAQSSSQALTASFVNTLNQNVLITGSITIGSGSLGPSENTLTLGPRDGVNEGGQLGLNAPGGTYTSASFLDLYQNRLRILRGTNAGSTGEVVSWNLGTLQMSLPAYTNASSFAGTATANLAVDSAGNVITVSTAGGAVFPYVGAAVITGSLVVSGSTGGIDTINGTLTNPGSITKVDWISALLNTTAGVTTVDWENKALYDDASGVSVDWGNRLLYETSNTYEALNYSNYASVSSQLYYNNIIPAQIQRELANNPTYAGQTIQAAVDAGVTDFQLVFLDTDGTWYPAEAAVAYKADKMLGICVDQAGGYVLIDGDVGVSDDNSQGAYVVGADHGLPVYVSATAGVMTTTAPSGAGAIVRVVGHIYYQSTSDVNWWTMKFRPSNDWYEI